MGSMAAAVSEYTPPSSYSYSHPRLPSPSPCPLTSNRRRMSYYAIIERASKGEDVEEDLATYFDQRPHLQRRTLPPPVKRAASFDLSSHRPAKMSRTHYDQRVRSESAVVADDGRPSYPYYSHGSLHQELHDKALNLTPNQKYSSRRSPPPHAGDSHNGITLPPFSEVSVCSQSANMTDSPQLLHTTGAHSPMRGSSRRTDSSGDGPHSRSQYDSPGWQESKHRRVDTLGDIYAHSREEPPHHSHRRMSSAYDSSRSAHHSPRTPAHGPVHPSRSSVSYAPPHASASSRAPVPSSSSHRAYEHPPMHSSMGSRHGYTSGPATSGPAYEQRPGYYHEPATPTQGYGYEQPRDPYYNRGGHAESHHASYENNYSNIHFQQHVGPEHNAFNRKRRGNLPKEATNLLKEWFATNRTSPYPTEDQKIDLCNRTGLSLNQVSDTYSGDAALSTM